MKIVVYLQYILLILSIMFLILWYGAYNSTNWISDDIKSYERIKESFFVSLISFFPLLLMTPISFPLALLGIKTTAYPDGLF